MPLEPFTGLQLDYLMSLDEEEQQAVDALVRATTVGSGRTLTPARLPAAEADGAAR